MNTIQDIEKSINKTYRNRIWTPFINALKTYSLIKENDKIAVCISGGKDSMLMALLFKMLLRHSDFFFQVEYVSMNPGYNTRNLELLKSNCELLEIPVKIFDTNVFRVANRQEKNPCYLCAKMRRGHLYNFAKENGCNKIALGHHFNDVIETTVMSMFYSSQLQGMMPVLDSTNFEGMKLIRPLYCVHENDIINWQRYNGLEFLQCACAFTEENEHDESLSKRKEIKNLIKELKKINPNIEKSIFNSIHNVHVDTFPSFRQNGEQHGFKLN